jgi:hypothetical protein
MPVINSVFSPVFKAPITDGNWQPTNLFTAGTVGYWYDPSDLTTMFQDNLGSTPVTTAGQTVGLILDKSQNGVGTNGSSRRNLLVATATLSTQSVTVTAVAHTLSFTGTGTVTLTGASIAGPLIGTGASNRVSLTFTPTAASLTLTVLGSVTLAQLEIGSTATAYQPITTSWSATLAGNHATQATSTQRPIYGINPITGTRNLGLMTSFTSVTGAAGSEIPNATGWSNITTTGGTRTYVASSQFPGNQALDIVGVTAARNAIAYTITPLPSTTYTVSFWIESVSGFTGFASYAVGAQTSGNINAPASTGRVSYNFTSDAVPTNVAIRFGVGTSGNANGSIRISGIQVEVGTTATAYQKVVSQYEVTQAGVPSVSYLAFDGVDDNLVLPSLTLTGTEPLFLCFGAKRLSTTSVTTIMSFGKGGASTTYPGFALLIRGSAAPAYAPQLLTASATVTSSLLALTGNTFGDAATRVLSATRTALRVNASALATINSTTDFTGFVTQNNRLGCNYSFANNNFWKGGIYSAIFAAISVLNNQITSAETYVNGKTGAY